MTTKKKIDVIEMDNGYLAQRFDLEKDGPVLRESVVFQKPQYEELLKYIKGVWG